jgi:hypothetical protein
MNRQSIWLLLPLLAGAGADVRAQNDPVEIRNALRDRRTLDFIVAGWSERFLSAKSRPPAEARFVMEPGADAGRCDTPRVRYNARGQVFTLSQTPHMFAVQVEHPGRKADLTLGEVQTLARTVFADARQLQLTGGKPDQRVKGGRAQNPLPSRASWLSLLRWSQAGGTTLFYFVKMEQRGNIASPVRHTASFTGNRYWFSPRSPEELPEGKEQWVVRSLIGPAKPNRAAEASADQQVARRLTEGFQPPAALRWLTAVGADVAPRSLRKRYFTPPGVVELTVSATSLTVTVERPVPADPVSETDAGMPPGGSVDKMADLPNVAALAAELFQDARGVTVRVTAKADGSREGRHPWVPPLMHL